MGAASKWIAVGVVVGAHGIHGELKVKPLADDGEILLTVRTVRLAGREYPVQASRWHKHNALMTLADVATRDQAASFHGLDVEVPYSELPLLPEDEYYWFEILGLTAVRADTGAAVGQVVRIIPTPGHDVYVIHQEGREYLLPAIAEAITAIDIPSGRMTIDPHALMEATGAD